MKGKLLISALAVVLLAVLFLPIPRGTYDDGGTREYTALTYKLIVWNKLLAEVNPDGSGGETNIYHRASIHLFPESRKTIDELWKIEWATHVAH